MIAIDTNILVRLVTRDDEDQAIRALTLFQHNEIYIGKTVLLETEWVLRFCYELSRTTILDTLKNTVGLVQVTVEDEAAVAQALAFFEDGMDFADALHLASCKKAEKFATFDESMKKRAISSSLQVVLV